MTLNIRAANAGPRGDFSPLGQRTPPNGGYVLPRDYAGPEMLRKGQIVTIKLGGGEVTPGLSAVMLDSAARASGVQDGYNLLAYEGSNYNGPDDAWMRLRVAHNPIPLLWILGSAVATLGAAWTVKEVVVDSAPAGNPAPSAPGPLSGVSAGLSVGGIPLLIAAGAAYLFLRR